MILDKLNMHQCVAVQVIPMLLVSGSVRRHVAKQLHRNVESVIGDPTAAAAVLTCLLCESSACLERKAGC